MLSGSKLNCTARDLLCLLICRRNWLLSCRVGGLFVNFGELSELSLLSIFVVLVSYRYCFYLANYGYLSLSSLSVDLTDVLQKMSKRAQCFDYLNFKIFYFFSIKRYFYCLSKITVNRYIKQTAK